MKPEERMAADRRIAAHVRRLNELFAIFVEAPEHPAPASIAIEAWAAVYGVAEGVGDLDRRPDEFRLAVTMAAILLDWVDSPPSRRLAAILQAEAGFSLRYVGFSYQLAGRRMALNIAEDLIVEDATPLRTSKRAWVATLRVDGAPCARSPPRPRVTRAVADAVRIAKGTWGMDAKHEEEG